MDRLAVNESIVSYLFLVKWGQGFLVCPPSSLLIITIQHHSLAISQYYDVFRLPGMSWICPDYRIVGVEVKKILASNFMLVYCETDE